MFSLSHKSSIHPARRALHSKRFRLHLPGLLAGFRGIPSEEGAAEMVPVYGQQTAAAAELDSIQPELPAI